MWIDPDDFPLVSGSDQGPILGHPRSLVFVSDLGSCHTKEDVNWEGRLEKPGGHPHPAWEILAAGATLNLGPGAAPDMVRLLVLTAWSPEVPLWGPLRWAAGSPLATVIHHHPLATASFIF